MSHQNISTRVDLLLAQGQFYLAGSQPHDAVACLQEATHLHPLNAAPHTLLGKIWAMQGDHAAAAASLRRAATLTPHAWENHALLGASLCALGRHREAVLCYRRAIPLNAHNLELYACLAQLLGTVGKIDEAYQTLERAKARTRAHGTEWAAMESVYHSLRDCEEEQAAK
jgi:Flp pilus assembly protein TadD